MKKHHKRKDGDEDEKKEGGQEREVGAGDYDLPDDIGTKIGERHPMQKDAVR